MKRIVCLTLALLLCMSASVLAESVPSKSTADMVSVAIDSAMNPNIPADSGFAVIPVQSEDAELSAEYAAHAALCETEIAKLAQTAGQVDAYFGAITDSEGNAIVLSEVLGAQALSVNEFMPISIENYDSAYGNVITTFQFKTPYTQGEQVYVLIGIQNADTAAIAWTAFAGSVTSAEGAVQVEFTPEIMEEIQNNVALLAVVSADGAVNQ